MKFFSLLFCCALLSGTILGAQARPLVPAEERDSDYSGQLPTCDHAQVLGEIESDFQSRERGYWNSDLGIVRFQNMQEIGFRATGADYVPRRYCRGSVIMSDEKIRDISYSIGEREGLLGLSWGTQWCVSGLDRNYAFGIDCRSARP